MEKNIFQKISKNSAVGAIIIAAVIISGSLLYINYSAKYQKTDKSDIMPAQQVVDKVINYINQKILVDEPSVTFTGVSEESGLYKIKFIFQGQEVNSYATKDGKLFFPDGYDLTESIMPTENTTPVGNTIGNFSVSQDEICKEGEKPIIYFFGSKDCPHCVWQEPIMKNVTEKFTGKISFRNNIDTDNDKDIFSKYSTGFIPTIVLGCKYYRVGSGKNIGEEQEIKALTALICKLTDNQPNDVCNQVQDLIDQIK